MVSKDKTIRCICGKEFVFTVDEQEFFKKMIEEGRFEGVYHEPKRCPSCRAAKREKKRLEAVRNESPFKNVYDSMKQSDRQFVDPSNDHKDHVS